MKIKIKNNVNKEKTLKKEPTKLEKEQKFRFSLKNNNLEQNSNKEEKQEKEKFEHDIYFKYEDDSQEFKNIVFSSEEIEENQNEHIFDLIAQNKENNELEIEYLKWMKMSNVEDLEEFLTLSPNFPND